MLITVAVALLVGYLLFKQLVDKFFPLNGLNQRYVLVTGCDHGFGHLLALELLKRGIPTFAGCLTQQGVDEIQQKAKALPGRIWTFRLDVTEQNSVDNALSMVEKQLGPGKGLWGLVNNAGILGPHVPDDWTSLEDYQKVMDVNFFGMLRMCHAFKHLLKSEKGRIVNVTSVAGRIPYVYAAPYSASKYAAESYSDVIRNELRPFGITVHIMEPGYFATNIINSRIIAEGVLRKWSQLSNELKKEYDEAYGKQLAERLQTHLQSSGSTRLHDVTEAFCHALTSRLPKQRYYISLDSKFVFIPASFLPTWLFDLLLSFVGKRQGLPLPNVSH